VEAYITGQWTFLVLNGTFKVKVGSEILEGFDLSIQSGQTV